MNPPDTRDHPVWDVYDTHRSVRLSYKYYCAKLHRAQRANFWIEFVLAATASTSAIAALSTIWETDTGRKVWLAFSVIAAVLAVAKPLLNLNKEMRRLSRKISTYRSLDFDFRELARAIKKAGSYNPRLEARFEALVKKVKKLDVSDPTASVDKKLVTSCMNEVNREMPPDGLFVPPMRMSPGSSGETLPRPSNGDDDDHDN